MSHAKPAGMYHCEHCNSNITPAEAIQPNASDEFCSLVCWYEHKGANVLNQIEADHTHCSSCYRPLKSIEKPPEWFLERREGVRDAICGFEYYTEHVEQEHGLTFCQCGNVDHHAENSILRNIEFKTAVKNLARLLAEYYADNQIAQKPNVRILARTLKETDNVAFSIGRAIYE